MLNKERQLSKRNWLAKRKNFFHKKFKSKVSVFALFFVLFMFHHITKTRENTFMYFGKQKKMFIWLLSFLFILICKQDLLFFAPYLLSSLFILRLWNSSWILNLSLSVLCFEQSFQVPFWSFTRCLA